MADEAGAPIETPKETHRQASAELVQELHNRARASSQELHKLLVSFATALLAVNYFALTTPEDPAAPGPQRVVAVLGLAAQAVAVLAGMFAYYCDMKRNYCQAKALKVTDPHTRESFYSKRNAWRQRQKWSIRSLNTSFTIGVIGSVAYVILRLFDVAM